MYSRELVRNLAADLLVFAPNLLGYSRDWFIQDSSSLNPTHRNKHILLTQQILPLQNADIIREKIYQKDIRQKKYSISH